MPPANIDGHKPFDHAIHEAAQYCALLFKGNPKVCMLCIAIPELSVQMIEPLYVSHRSYASGTSLSVRLR